MKFVFCLLQIILVLFKSSYYFDPNFHMQIKNEWWVYVNNYVQFTAEDADIDNEIYIPI